jgi:hypothetical protein
MTLALLMIFTVVAMQPAHAQTNDTWKSAAIIGGATAAGAYIGHKVAGPTGTWIGAGVGAAAGYAIDRRRRQNQVYNQGYYDPNGGYYPSGNNGYYGGPYDNGSYPYSAQQYPGYPGNGYAASRGYSQRRSRR